MKFRPGPKAATALALAAGALAALAHPPFGFLPGLLGYALLMRLVDDAPEPRPLRAAFWRGWLAAFSYFVIGCWWVAEAFMVDARGQGWMAPFAVALLPAGLGLFWGAACLVYRRFRPQGLTRILFFAGVFSAFEWLRGHVLTGFPWNLPGETWRAGSAPSQFASVVGAYGLTWITLAIAAAFSPIGREPWRKARWAVGGGVVALAALYAFGLVRLAQPLPPDPNAPLVRVVQPDVKQESKYDAAMFRSIVFRYMSLTARPAARKPDIIVWPEGAVPQSANEFLQPGSWTESLLSHVLEPGQTLIMGTYRIDETAKGERYYNSLIAVRAEGRSLRLTGVYDKYRLVPFGEYLPAESILTPLGFKNLTHIGDSFSAGPRPAPISSPGIPLMQPLICYEGLYPGFTREGAARSGARARWIVNVSNDAWFGPTSGPLQHLNLASYRAIEEGLPMVRATPTGVSAFVDAYGRIVPGQSLGLGRIGVVDSLLPPSAGPTPFSVLGEWLFAILLLSSTFLPRPGLMRGFVSWLYRKSVTTWPYWAKETPSRGTHEKRNDG